MRNRIRYWLMPGLDMFTRRRVHLSRHWKKGPRAVLDAGSGNGWFSYLAWKSGARVRGLNIVQPQLDKAEAFYNDWLGIPKSELSFQRFNLYDLHTLEESFDEIICYETLEHILDDRRVCREFFRLLRPGGALHLCCPFATHPKWVGECLDLKEEWGGHVRPGYTMESYRELLAPLGFQIAAFEGMGGTRMVWLRDLVDATRSKVGDAPCAPLLLAMVPVVAMDTAPAEDCYSLYVKAVKPL